MHYRIIVYNFLFLVDFCQSD